MSQLHLIIGPVGAGKSTFLGHLCEQQEAVGINLDAWMARLYGDDERPAEGKVAWYLERRARCLEQIWQVTTAIIAAGTSVVLEPGLVQRDRRLQFYKRVAASEIAMRVYCLEAPREQRRARVERRNREQGDTFAMHVPMDVFELSSDLWQSPDADERAQYAVSWVEGVQGPDGLCWLY